MFWLITSEEESFSTRKFVTFPDIKYGIRTKNFSKSASGEPGIVKKAKI